MDIFTTTPWQYDTSAEFSTSILMLTGGEGRLYFTNPSTDQKFSVPYTYLSVGASKGAIFNVAESITETPSGGISSVITPPWGSFGVNTFPCSGYLVIGGLTSGVFKPSFIDDAGAELCVAIFGGVPQAGVVFWGHFSAVLPNAGAGIALATFYDPVMEAGEIEDAYTEEVDED
jgi:hypothetical protein